MSDFRTPPHDESAGGLPVEHELSADAYEATVPTRLSGFRGTSPTALVLAGAIAFAIILVSLLTFFHRASASPTANGSSGMSRASSDVAGPAAPGLGGTDAQVPFIPEATPAAAGPTPSQQPLMHMQQAPVAAAAPPQQLAEAPAMPAPQSIVPAPLAAVADSGSAAGRMQIDQPRSGSQDAQAAADVGGTQRFVPVYRNGRIVSVVPQLDTSAGGRSVQSGGAKGNAQSGSGSDSGAEAPSQFVAGGDTSLGAGNSGLLEARRYSRDQQNDNLGYARPQTARQLATGSVINARLMSKIESDLPGPVLAQVTQPVYDSATHSVVIIPAGSRIFGTYDEETVSTSSRLLMAFNRLIFPDGEEFDIGGQPGTSAGGTAGFGGDVDMHRGTLYTSAILLSILAGAEAAITPPTTTGLYGSPSVSTSVQSAAGAELSQVGNKVLNQAVQRPATVIIRPPYAFQIVVTRDLPLDQYAVERGR